MSGRPLSRDQLESALSEQIEFLNRSADAFDAGAINEAKRMAVVLRVLLHKTKRSHALLDQVGALNQPFFSTAIPYNPNNYAPQHGLLVLVIAGEKGSFSAPLDYEVSGQARKQIPFDQWWGTDVVIADSHNIKFTRQSLVLSVANKDGGAHVDPEPDEDYYRLRHENSIGWMEFLATEEGPVSQKPAFSDVELHCIRQIAHEVLKTLNPSYTKSILEGDIVIAQPTLTAFEHTPPELMSPYDMPRNTMCPCKSGKRWKHCHGKFRDIAN